MISPLYQQSNNESPVRYFGNPNPPVTPQGGPPVLLILISVLTLLNTFLLVATAYFSGYTWYVVHGTVEFLRTFTQGGGMY